VNSHGAARQGQALLHGKLLGTRLIGPLKNSLAENKPAVK
jgi:hypothetical protein